MDNLLHPLGLALMMWFIPAVCALAQAMRLHNYIEDDVAAMKAIRIALWFFALGTIGIVLYNI